MINMMEKKSVCLSKNFQAILQFSRLIANISSSQKFGNLEIFWKEIPTHKFKNLDSHSREIAKQV